MVCSSVETHHTKEFEVLKMVKLRCQTFCVTFEVFMAVTMKNAVFWDVMQCGVTSQKTAFFIVTTVKTSDIT
jgi:hypothetical protein